MMILTDIVDILESRTKPTKNLKTYVIHGYLNIKNITEAKIKVFFSGRLANEVTDIFLSRSVIETGNKEEKDC